MKPVVRRSPAAREDYLEIWLYVAERSVAAADALVESFDDALKTLAGQPALGRRRDELERGLRSWPVGRYVLLYRPLPDGVELARVLHGSRDLQQFFGTDE